MQKLSSPKIILGIIAAFAILILVILPVSLQFAPNQVAVQEIPSTAEPIAVAQIDSVKPKAAQSEVSDTTSVVEYTLRTQIGGNPAMAYVGVGGEIDGVVNPELKVNLGDTIHITVINGDPVLHDLVLDEFGVHTEQLAQAEQTATIEFVASEVGEFEYYCSIPGHREIGMKGLLRVSGKR